MDMAINLRNDVSRLPIGKKLINDINNMVDNGKYGKAFEGLVNVSMGLYPPERNEFVNIYSAENAVNAVNAFIENAPFKKAPQKAETVFARSAFFALKEIKDEISSGDAQIKTAIMFEMLLNDFNQMMAEEDYEAALGAMLNFFVEIKNKKGQTTFGLVMDIYEVSESEKFLKDVLTETQKWIAIM